MLPRPLWTRHSSISSCLLRTGRRRPTNREGSAESIEDRQGIRSTQYVLSGAWFGDGRACCLLPALGYSSSLIYRLVFSPSLEEKLGGGVWICAESEILRIATSVFIRAHLPETAFFGIRLTNRTAEAIARLRRLF
jgi:hypothetical protein